MRVPRTNLRSFQRAARHNAAMKLFLQRWSFDNCVHLIIAARKRTF